MEYSDGVSMTVGDETIEVATVIDGYRVHRRYQGYTRRQCVAMFREYLKTLEV